MSLIRPKLLGLQQLSPVRVWRVEGGGMRVEGEEGDLRDATYNHLGQRPR